MFSFFRSQLAQHRLRRARAKQAPAGYIFIRNYKRTNTRIARVIQEACLSGRVHVSEVAFDQNACEVPHKVAVYVQDNETASIFFQYYNLVKQEEFRRAYSH